MLGRYLLFLMLTCLATAAPLFSTTTAIAQSNVAAKPIVGLRDNRPTDFALQNAKVIVAPGQTIDNATVLIQGSSIIAVGRSVEVPAGYMTIDCTGKQIYAGLIDAYSEIEVPVPLAPVGHWNPNITPHRSTAAVATEPIANIDKLRSQGLTVRLVAPKGGIVKGTSSIVLLGGDSAGRTLLKDAAWHHLQLTVPRGSSRSQYPNSPMGAVALLRQSMYDANWYRDAWSAYRANSSLPRPETNIALDHLSRAVTEATFVIDAPNERMAIRAGSIADEFSLRTVLRGSGREYRQLDQIARLNRPILVPVNFPAAPDVESDESARNTTLQELMHWDLAPQNPARLAGAGLTICLTSDGMEKPETFLAQVRKSVASGLQSDTALAAITTAPAQLMEIGNQVGKVQAGMLANLVVTDGDLFDEQTKVLQTWVAGEQFIIEADKQAIFAQWIGTWLCETEDISFTIRLSEKAGKLTGVALMNEDKEKTISLGSTQYQRDLLTATVPLQKIDPTYPDGVSRLSIRSVSHGEQTTRFPTLILPDGDSTSFSFSAVIPEQDEESVSETDNGEVQDTESDNGHDEANLDPENNTEPEVTTLLFPLGGFGLAEPITEQPVVMFRGVTVWTCDEAGVLEQADVLIRDGLISQIGQQLPVPENCQVIDARGKHISPGIIDCHSHIATDGGINESAQEVTSEVRISDFIDNSSIAIYRQLAGGTTTANILHGSANPIGGQNQVIKFRWGSTMEDLRMAESPAGIKFALGENVTRNSRRYPNTRMGVEQIIRDQLLAAREYQSKWQRWQRGQRDSLPPRRDLQLDAIVEIQNGERWIHCHSYRQDEINATLDVLEEFGIRIGTLQHVLEGYKVADRMAKHGAMGSTFSDWWAYKFEVFDAIPHNGALMHDQGIVVSFNSDDPELGRRLNTEAAKATKYGSVPAEQALKFVTLNPAKQLRIDQYVGSLQVGKHADLVVWSGPPLSTLSRCEQTWIDGRQYFSIETDQKMRVRDQAIRARLIQKALASDEKSESDNKQDPVEEDRWLRHDIYCNAHGDAEYDHRGQR